MAIYTLDIDILEWLWNNNIKSDLYNNQNILDNALGKFESITNCIYPSIKCFNINYTFKNFYQIHNWFKNKGIIHTLKLSCSVYQQIFNFNDIEILNWYFNDIKESQYTTYQSDICNMYISIIKYGSCKFLDWLWNHEIRLNNHIIDEGYIYKIYRMLVRYGCNQMFEWFINKYPELFDINKWIESKENLNDDLNQQLKNIHKIWFSNPNHRILKYIVPTTRNIIISNMSLMRINIKSIKYLNNTINSDRYFEILKYSTQYMRTDIVILYQKKLELLSLKSRSREYGLRFKRVFRYKI